MTIDEKALLNKLYSASLLDGGVSDVLGDMATAFPEIPFSYQAQCVYRNELYDSALFNHGEDALARLRRAETPNPFPPVALKADPLGVAKTRDFITPEEVENTDFFDEYYKHERSINRAIGIILHRRGDDSAFVAANFPKALKKRDEDKVLQLFEFLRPHFQGAFKLLLEIKQRELLIEDGAFWLDQIPTAAFVISPDRHVQQMNRFAQKLLAKSCGVQLDRVNRLDAQSGTIRKSLESGINRAHALELPIGPVSLSPGKRGGCFFFVSPIKYRDQVHSSLAPFLNPSLPLLLTVFDPDEKPLGSKEIISTALGLSESESRLLHELVTGGSLRDIADRLGISYHTARNQLASATSKTGSKSQTEIVRTASHLLAKLSASGGGRP